MTIKIFQPNAGHIILPRKFVDVEPPSGKVGLLGEYNLRVIRGDGSIKSETGWFPNIILDSGLNRWGTTGVINGAAVGTGTSTPTAVQTGLDAQVTFTTTSGIGNNSGTAEGSPPYFTTRTFVYRTTLGAITGQALSEVSVGWATGSSMFSRALILDSGGTPTTITVLATEQLDIIYRLRGYPPAVDTSSVHTIGGVNYTVTGRAGFVTNSSLGWPIILSGPAGESNWVNSVYEGSIGVITGFPSGSSASSGRTLVAYTNNSLSRNASISIPLDQGNFLTGVRSFFTSTTIGSFQYDFGASILKNNTKTLVLNHSVSWARRP